MKLRSRVFATLALPAFLAGCQAGESEPQRQPAGAPLEAAIVPGANLLLEADLQAVRQAPIFAVLAPMLKDEAEDEGDDEGVEVSGEAGESEPAPEFDEEKFFAVTGLSPEDFISVVVSARLEPPEPSPEGGEEEGDGASLDPEAFFGAAQKAPAAVSLLLARSLELDRLEQGLREGGGAMAELSRVEVAGTPALHGTSSKPGEPETWAAILGGNTLFVAFNQESLEGALQRAQSGQPAATAPEIEQARAALPEAAQGGLVFVAPEALRELIRERIAKAAEDPGAAAMLGFVKPFENLRSIGVGVEAATDLVVATTWDLGDAAVAGQAQAMFGGLVVPMAQAGLAQAAGRSPGEMSDRLVISSQGSALRLVYRMTAEDAAGFEATRQKEAAEKAAAEEAESASEEKEDPGA